jgi:uncharacterized protein YktA (UPF0223 family)
MKKLLTSFLFFSCITAAQSNENNIVDEFKALSGLSTETGFCELDGVEYPYNQKVAMNRQLLKTYAYLNGKEADESLVVVMQCKYIVDPLSHDHPEHDKRKYVWVAGQ